MVVVHWLLSFPSITVSPVHLSGTDKMAYIAVAILMVSDGGGGLPNHMTSCDRTDQCAFVEKSSEWKAVWNLYRVIHKSLWDFQPLWYSSQNGHAEGEYGNRGRDTPTFCLTLQVLDMSTLGDAADVNPVIKFLPHTCNVCGRNLIISRLLYRRVRNSRRDLWITLYLFVVDLVMMTGWRVDTEVTVAQVEGLSGYLRSGAEEKHE